MHLPVGGLLGGSLYDCEFGTSTFYCFNLFSFFSFFLRTWVLIFGLNFLMLSVLAEQFCCQTLSNKTPARGIW
jgi:hypothetical protein